MQFNQGSESEMIRVLVADDTRIHTQLLADALRRDRQLDVISTPAGSRDVVEAVKLHRVDVVVLSSNLDEEPLRGFEVLRQLRASHPHILAIMLLDSSKRDMVLQAFRAGARGIFSRHDSVEILSKCIHSVREGQIWANSEQMKFAVEALATSPLVRAVEDRLFVMDQSIATTNDEMRSIDGQLKLVANEVDLDPKLYVKRLQYAQQLQNTRDQYQAIMPRLANMKAQADLQVPDSRVISPATAPVDPSSPDFAVVFGGALAGGLALGAGLSLAQGDGRLRARSVRQLQNLPGVQGSLLVQLDRRQRIPIVKGLESTTGLSTTFENSLARLRTMIDRYECERAVSYGVKAGRVISVTSSVRDNQGVMLSAALSSGCQLGGEKVLLLVDDISGFIRDYPGALELSDARNGDPFTAVPGLPDLYVDPHSGLSVSSLRSLDGHAGGALGTTAMGIQLDERMALYKRVYGTIFVEAPPVQDLARLAELASRSDLILYCARAGRYPTDRIKADIASISDVANRDTPILAVLTRLA